MALTVTAAQSGAGTAVGIALTVKVVTGVNFYATSQFASSISDTVPELSITPLNTGSWIYGTVSNPSANATFTPASGTTFSLNTLFSGDFFCYGTFRSNGTTTSGTPLTVGATAPSDASHKPITLFEVPVAPGQTLAEDASSPSPISNNTVTTITTASFTPPGGSYLVAMVSSDSSGAANQNMTVAVSDTYGLTWTNQVSANFISGSGSQQASSIWTAIMPIAAKARSIYTPSVMRAAVW